MSHLGTFQLDDYVFRAANESDLIDLERVASHVDFAVGLHNRHLMYKVSPESFVVIISPDGHMVGFITGNGAVDNFFYQHQIVVLPTVQKRSLMRKYFDIFFAHKDEFQPKLRMGFMGNYISVQKIFVTRPLVFDYKQIGFEGFVNHNRNLTSSRHYEGEIRRFSNSDLPDLLAYDQKLYITLGYSRKRAEFITSWVSDEFGITYVARNREGMLEGYGVLRQISPKYHRFTPVYADSTDCGYYLLCALAKDVPEKDKVYLSFPAKNQASMEFCAKLGLPYDYSEVRVYDSCRLDLPTDKLFAETEFWPI